MLSFPKGWERGQLRDLVYISFHDADEAWLKRLRVHLNLLVQSRNWSTFCTVDIQSGANIQHSIERALERARAIVLLISADYIAESELERMVETAHGHGIPLLWLPIKPSNVQATRLGALAPLLSSERTLSELSYAEAERKLVKVCERVVSALDRSDTHIDRPPFQRTVTESNEIRRINKPQNNRHWGGGEFGFEIEKGRSLLVEDNRPMEAALWLARALLGGSQSALLLYLLRNALRPLEDIEVIISEHTDAVTDVEFGPNSSHIATTSADKTAILWNIEKKVVSHRLTGHERDLLEAKFSIDGNSLVTASCDGTARLWNVLTGDLRRIFGDHNGFVRSAVLSPNQRRVVTSSNDGIVRLWSTEDDAPVLELRGHTLAANAARFCLGGRRVISIGNDSTVRQWCTVTGKPLQPLKEHYGQIVSMNLSPDGAWLLTGGTDATVRLWSIDSGKLLQTFQHVSGGISAVSLSPSCRRAAAGSEDGVVQMWEIGGSNRVARLDGHEDRVSAVEFSPDGRRLLTAGYDGCLRLWAADTGQLLGNWAVHGTRITTAKWNADGRSIATACDDGTARIITVCRPQRMTLLKAHEKAIVAAGLSRNGSLVITAGKDGLGRLFSVHTGAPLILLRGHAQELTSISFSPDDKQILTAGADGSARLWDVGTGKQTAILAARREFEGILYSHRVHSARFSPNGSLIISCSDDNNAYLWNAQTCTLQHILGSHSQAVLDACFSPDGEHLVTISADGTARIWRVQDGSSIAVLSGHQHRLVTVEYSPNGAFIVTASYDGTARIFSAANGKAVAILEGHKQGLATARFSPNSEQVLTASGDGVARLWNAASGRLIFEIRGHRGALTDAGFSIDGWRIVTGGSDGTVRVWSAENGKPIDRPKELSAPITRVCFSPNDCNILAACTDGTAAYWDASKLAWGSAKIVEFLDQRVPLRFDGDLIVPKPVRTGPFVQTQQAPSVLWDGRLDSFEAGICAWQRRDVKTALSCLNQALKEITVLGDKSSEAAVTMAISCISFEPSSGELSDYLNNRVTHIVQRNHPEGNERISEYRNLAELAFNKINMDDAALWALRASLNLNSDHPESIVLLIELNLASGRTKDIFSTNPLQLDDNPANQSIKMRYWLVLWIASVIQNLRDRKALCSKKLIQSCKENSKIAQASRALSATLLGGGVGLRLLPQEQKIQHYSDNRTYQYYPLMEQRFTGLRNGLNRLSLPPVILAQIFDALDWFESPSKEKMWTERDLLKILGEAKEGKIAD